MAESTLLGRSAGTAYSRLVQDVFGLTTRLANEREKLKTDRNLSDEGRRSREAALAKALVKDHVHICRPLRRAKADISAQRKSFKMPEIDQRDVVSEMQRAELRSYIRGLPLDDRTRAAYGLDDAGQLAILSAPSLLSGLPVDRYENLKAEFMDRQFGSQTSVLDAASAELEAVQAAATMTRQDLQKTSGLSEHEFLALEKSHEN